MKPPYPRAASLLSKPVKRGPLTQNPAQKIYIPRRRVFFSADEKNRQGRNAPPLAAVYPLRFLLAVLLLAARRGYIYSFEPLRPMNGAAGVGLISFHSFSRNNKTIRPLENLGLEMAFMTFPALDLLGASWFFMQAGLRPKRFFKTNQNGGYEHETTIRHHTPVRTEPGKGPCLRHMSPTWASTTRGNFAANF